MCLSLKIKKNKLSQRFLANPAYFDYLFRDLFEDRISRSLELILTILVFLSLVLLICFIEYENHIIVLLFMYPKFPQFTQSENLSTSITLCDLIVDWMSFLECCSEPISIAFWWKFGECVEIDPSLAIIHLYSYFNPILVVRTTISLNLRFIRNFDDITILEDCSSIDLIDSTKFVDVVNNLHSLCVSKICSHDVYWFITELQSITITSVSKCSSTLTEFHLLSG